MGVAEILIVVLLGLTFVSFFVTALHCRVQEKIWGRFKISSAVNYLRKIQH